MREERCVRCDDADDRAGLVDPAWSGNPLADQLSDRHAVHAETVPPPVVRLHQHTNDVSVHNARRRSDASFELVADHPRASADVPLLDRVA